MKKLYSLLVACLVVQVAIAQFTYEAYPSVEGYYRDYQIYPSNDGYIFSNTLFDNETIEVLELDDDGTLLTSETLTGTPNIQRLSNGNIVKSEVEQSTLSKTARYKLYEPDGTTLINEWSFSTGIDQSIKVNKVFEFPDGDLLISFPVGLDQELWSFETVNVYFGKYNPNSGLAAFTSVYHWSEDPNGGNEVPNITGVAFSDNGDFYASFLQGSTIIRTVITKFNNVGDVYFSRLASTLERYVRYMTPTTDGGIWYYITGLGIISKLNADNTITTPWFNHIDAAHMAATKSGAFIEGPNGTTYLTGSVTPMGYDAIQTYVLAIGNDGSDQGITYYEVNGENGFLPETGFLEDDGTLVLAGYENVSNIFVSDNVSAFLKIEPSSPSDCPEDINGYTLIGEFENSQYYISNEKAQWNTANAAAEAIATDLSINAHLATISSQAENDFIQNNIEEIVGIGFNDIANEGTIEWVTNEPVAFNNLDDDCGWCPGNTDDNDFGVFYPWNGKWDFDNQWVSRYYLVEVECGNQPMEGLVVECPSSIFAVAPHGGDYTAFIEWELPVVTTDCPQGGITINGPSGSEYLPVTPPGSDGVFITYEISDACGNTEQCFVELTIVPEATEVICPEDIQVEATSDAGAIVNYDNPAVNSYCTPSDMEIVLGLPSGSEFPIGTTTVEISYYLNGDPFVCQTSQSCSFNITITDPDIGGGDCPDQLDGFEYLGDYNGSAYFLSEEKMTWSNAAVAAVDAGGHLAVINNQEENDFIQENINDIAIIGFSDTNTEGTIEWITGDAVAFNNIEDDCSWCPGNTEQNDFGIFYPWSGKWDFDNQWVTRKYLVEIACDVAPPEGISLTCTDIDNPSATLDDPDGIAVEWALPTATTTCPDGIVSIEQVAGPQSGEYFNVHQEYFAVYIITDNCGNTEECYIDFTVSGVSFYECPEDIVITATSADGAIVSYEDQPFIIHSCDEGSWETVSGPASGSLFPIGVTEVTMTNFLNGSNTYCQTWAVCNFTITVLPEGGENICDEAVPGYELVGTLGASSYYITNEVVDWQTAKTMAEDNGGFLPSITSSAENNFIQNAINDIAWIGLNDINEEGTPEWINGEAYSYDRVQFDCGWCPGNTPDNDYGMIYPWNGDWDYASVQVLKRGLMERPCNSPANGNSQALVFNNQPTIRLHKAFPNPTHAFIHFQFSSYKEAYTNMNIYNLTGQLVKTIPFQMYDGRNEVKLDVRQMEDGIYFTRIDGIRGSEFKFVVATGL